MKGNILIVDDNPDNLRVLEGILAADGHEVRPAVSGEVALRAVAARPPDLILLDIMMPGMEGFDVCRRLRADSSTASIPVLFISALGETDDKLRAFDAGGLDYITKPFAEREVLARVRTHLRLAAAQEELRLANRKLNLEIEARKEIERNLVEAQRIAQVGNWTFDLSSGNVISASVECYRIYDVNPDEFGGDFEAFMGIVHPDDRDRVGSNFGNFLMDHIPFSVEYRIVRSDRGERIIHAQVEAILDEHGKPVLGTGTAQDVTERREAEDERLSLLRNLLGTQKLESLGTIAGGIAHNFNNMLAGILGNIELCLTEMCPDSPRRKHIELAMSACDRAANLTRQMLAYSGKGLFMPKAIDVNAFVSGNAELFRSSIGRNATLEISTVPDLPFIEADEGQIQQAVFNLLINASEAVGTAPGRIVVGTGVRECDDEYLGRSRLEEIPPAGPFVYIDVSDTGCGMNEETRDRLFDPFFTTKFTGRGLGLSAVMGIVRSHKGAIMVESEKGRGSAFRLLFPASGEKGRRSLEGNVQADRAESGAAFSGTILVADDEEQVREMCMGMLELLGFSAIGAADGKEAVSEYKEHANDIDLVILDLTMPNMDGIGSYYELKRITPGVRVILSSGYGEQSVSERFPGDRPAGFIQKPYRLRDLQAKIEEVMKSATRPGACHA